MKKKVFLVIPIVICILCLYPPLCVIARESIPSFNVVNITPPDDIFGRDDWDKVTYSIEPGGFLLGQYFNVRKEEYYYPPEKNNLYVSRDDFITYFTDELSKKGWNRNDEEVDCRSFIVEYNVLRGKYYSTHGENFDIVGYSQNNFGEEFIEGLYDQVCLAIWQRKEYDELRFQIILVSVRPSILRQYWGLLGSLN